MAARRAFVAAAWCTISVAVVCAVGALWLWHWQLTLPLEAAFGWLFFRRVRNMQTNKRDISRTLRVRGEHQRSLRQRAMQMRLHVASRVSARISARRADEFWRDIACQARLTADERAASLARVLAAIATAHRVEEDGVARFLSLWHNGAPPETIKRRNMERFIAAHFLFAHHEELDEEGLHEVNALMLAIESAVGRSFEAGDTPDVVAMRVSMPSHRLRWVHYPLGVYLTLGAVQAAAHAAFLAAGFRYLSIGEIRYFYRPPTACTPPPPVVLLPGIGIGVGAYLALLLGPLSADGAAIFAVELPQVTAGRFSSVKQEDDVVASLLAMLRRHTDSPTAAAVNMSVPPPPARWVAHSYSSFVVGWLLRTKEAAPALHTLLLLDPVAVLVAWPHVLHGAVYRGPLQPPLAALFPSSVTQASSGGARRRLAAAASRLAANMRLALNYAIVKEAYIAMAVQTHFMWLTSSVWLEDVPPGCKVTLALSERDVLLPVREVMTYATAVASRRSHELRLDVLLMERHNHGEVALNRTYWPRLAAALAVDTFGSADAPPETS